MKKMKRLLIAFLLVLVIVLLAYSKYTEQAPKENNEEQETSEEEVITTNEEILNTDDPYENETTLNSNFTTEEEITLKYDQYITASGYAGASDNVYYTRNGSLYHLILSTEETIKLAEGVDKIEKDLDGMRAYKGSNFKLIKEDDYVTYVD